jgi:cytochrome P450
MKRCHQTQTKSLEVVDLDRYSRDNEGWIPFGSGHRSCIGQKLATVEAKLILAVIAQVSLLENEYSLTFLSFVRNTLSDLPMMSH